MGVRDAARDMTKGLDPTKFDADSETGKLAKERDDQAAKIQAASARKAAERKAREAEEALAQANALEEAAKSAETKE